MKYVDFSFETGGYDYAICRNSTGGLGMKSYLKGWQTVFTLLKCSQRLRVAENVLCKHPFSSIIPTYGETKHVSTKLFSLRLDTTVKPTIFIFSSFLN